MSLFGAIADHYVAAGGGGGTYASEVLADSPILYWRLGESSGTTAADASGNSRTGTYIGGPTLGSTGLITGDSDTAVTVSSGKYAKSGSITLPFTTALTVEAIYKPATTPSADQYLVSKMDVNKALGSNYSFGLNVNSSLRFGGFVVVGSTIPSAALSANNACVVGAKNHVVFAIDGSSSSLYLNGSLVGTGAGAGGTINSNSTPFLANGTFDEVLGAANFCNGVLDEVAVYATKLSASRIAAHAALV